MNTLVIVIRVPGPVDSMSVSVALIYLPTKKKKEKTRSAWEGSPFRPVPRVNPRVGLDYGERVSVGSPDADQP